MVVVNGKQYWIQDAYVTADTYPYSNAENLPDGTHNYLRNSVKVVTDAYNGTMSFYISDSTDPIIRAYAATFPDLFKPLSSMPLGLRQHIRVPPTQFAIQSTVYATYHISDPAIVELNIPTGIPLVYELNEDLTPIRHYYLGDPAAAAEAAARVASQTSPTP